MTLAELIDKHGLTVVAKACGLHRQHVLYWKKKGLPKGEKFKQRRSYYENQLAKLEGVPVAELRKQLKEGGE